jgi:hypothetical protein
LENVMRRLSDSFSLRLFRSRNMLALGLAAALGLSAAATVPVHGTLPGPCLPDPEPPCLPAPSPSPGCITLVKQCEEISVPLQGSPASGSGCIPPGTYVQGSLRIKTSLYQSTCKTRIKTETSTCNAKICVPGVGLFTSSEFTLDETEVELLEGETEVESYGKFKYRLGGGCGGETYTLEYKLKIKVDLTGRTPVARCERLYMDCYLPCCGSASAPARDDD